MFSALPIPNERAAAAVADPRLPVVSFTGSGPVGAQIRAAVPHKHVTLKLGGNAAALICRAPTLARRWRRHRRRAELPGRSDAVRRGEGQRSGREGVASAMEDYTEPRLMVLTRVAL